MNYDTAIQELERKRDFYSAAIDALRKIALAEVRGANERAVIARSQSRKGWTQERRAKMAAAIARRKAKANSNDTTAPITSAPDRELVTQ